VAIEPTEPTGLSWPSDRLKRVAKLSSAQSLYKSLGDNLHLPSDKKKEFGISPAWVDDAKRVRRLLEKQYGFLVRSPDEWEVVDHTGKT